jgi:hypothetical protein
MDEWIVLIDEIQHDVFDYRLDAFSHHFLRLIDLLAIGTQALDKQERGLLEPILNAMLHAYERKDYLMIADLLFFELRPLLAPIEQEIQYELL